MKYKKIIISWLSIFILFFLRLTVIKVAKSHSRWVEQYYSRGIYPLITKILTGISNFFPFSIGEVIIFGLILLLIFVLVRLIILIFKKQYLNTLKNFTGIILAVVVLLCFLDLSWLMNNYRTDIRNLMELPNVSFSKDDLTLLFEALIEKTNSLRDDISNEVSIKEILHTANDGYKELDKEYEFINKDFVIVKGLLSSRLQTISGYAGMYLFFIGEPTINIEAPIFTLPHAACHEIAHQKGFAEEEAANYIGFLACKANKSIYFQYSGYFTAMQYVGSALYNEDSKLYYKIADLYSDKVIEDIKYENFFWDTSTSKSASKVADKINDTYLKSYNQPEGIKSYGKFVDLLISDYIKNGFKI